MRAVSNTSPISSLASIGRLSLLRTQFSEVWLPPTVLKELSAHPSSEALAEIQTAISAKWMQSSALQNSRLFDVLCQHLHAGEAEAITLAVQMNADIVLIDEREGRQLAVRAGLQVTGTLGVLLRVKLHGEIRDLGKEIQALRTKANFFVAQNLEAQILAAGGE